MNFLFDDLVDKRVTKFLKNLPDRELALFTTYTIAGPIVGERPGLNKDILSRYLYSINEDLRNMPTKVSRGSNVSKRSKRSKESSTEDLTRPVPFSIQTEQIIKFRNEVFLKAPRTKFSLIAYRGIGIPDDFDKRWTTPGSIIKLKHDISVSLDHWVAYKFMKHNMEGKCVNGIIMNIYMPKNSLALPLLRSITELIVHKSQSLYVTDVFPWPDPDINTGGKIYEINCELFTPS